MNGFETIIAMHCGIAVYNIGALPSPGKVNPIMTGYNNHQTDLDLSNLHKEITEKLQVCKIILLIEKIHAIFGSSECFY